MYMPASWWHVVLNLDLTVAVTHNYASTANFPDLSYQSVQSAYLQICRVTCDMQLAC